MRAERGTGGRGAIAAAIAIAAGGGCGGDPIEGRWEADVNSVCGDRADFVIDDELRGDGSVCACSYDFTVEARGGGDYLIDIDFEGVCFVPEGRYDCHLSDDENALDCEELGRYERQE